MPRSRFRRMLAAGLLALTALITITPAQALTCPPRYAAPMRREALRWWPEGPDFLWLCAQAYQESGWNPLARSGAGAAGLMQFMPGTWRQAEAALHLGLIPPTLEAPAITAGAWYMATLKARFQADRDILDAHDLALASYNAGPGNIEKAARRCDDARLWRDTVPCLASVTGHANAHQTSDYVARIHHWREILQ